LNNSRDYFLAFLNQAIFEIGVDFEGPILPPLVATSLLVLSAFGLLAKSLALLAAFAATDFALVAAAFAFAGAFLAADFALVAVAFALAGAFLAAALALAGAFLTAALVDDAAFFGGARGFVYLLCCGSNFLGQSCLKSRFDQFCGTCCGHFGNCI
jgi:hypothetical protein